MKGCCSGLAQNFCPPIIRNDKACLKGNDFRIECLRNGKEKLVTELAILGPLLINAKIPERGFDFDYPNGAAVTESNNIGAPARGKGEFVEDCKAEGPHKAANAALDSECGFRLAAIRPQFNCHTKPFQIAPFFNFCLIFEQGLYEN